jgi:predicted phosphodiesterase
MVKHIVFSDVHGRNTAPIRKKLETREVDVGICLGDFDRTATANEIKSLQEDYTMHVIPGNHDYSHINKVRIGSSTMSKQNINSEMMWEEWEDDKEARNYVKDLLKRTKFNFEIGGNKTLVVHGGLGGNYQAAPAELWYRIKTDQNYLDNFGKMSESDIKIMIRGHDHESQFIALDSINGLKKYSTTGYKHKIFSNQAHIVNPGAYCNGNYAIITSDIPNQNYLTVEFCKLGDE